MQQVCREDVMNESMNESMNVGHYYECQYEGNVNCLHTDKRPDDLPIPYSVFKVHDLK